MEWISVNDRLPEKCGEYIVFVKNLTGRIAYFNPVFVASFYYTWNFQAWEDNVVTHWMPLPAPPKEDA